MIDIIFCQQINGGTIVAFITDFVFVNDQSLRYSLAVVSIIFYPVAAIIAALGLTHYRKALLVEI